MSLEITDTHTHLDSESFAQDQQQVIERALAAGVTRMITIGAGDGTESAIRAVKLAESSPHIWCSVGVHPHDAGSVPDLRAIKPLASHPRVVAIGETGLDFFKEWSPRADQYKLFEMQIELALEVEKPIVIHCRNAAKEVLEVLSRYPVAKVGGVFHCFSEDVATAEHLASIGFSVSFPGILTFKKSENIREAARKIPTQQILVETDAPYLAPEPYRGARCEPAHVVETARMLADVKGVSLLEISRITTENALRLFSRMS